MVMERSFTPRERRAGGTPHSDNLDAIHDRLGIDKLWDADHSARTALTAPLLPAAPSSPSPTDPSFADSHPAQSNPVALLTPANSDDVVVVGAPPSAVPAVMPWDTTTGAQGISLLGRRMLFLRKRAQILAKSYDECRRITALFSKTFYMGTTLLSAEKRRAVWAIYTWCRRTDDLVDGPRVTQHASELRATLADWEHRLDQIFDGDGRDGLDLAMADTVSCYPGLNISPFRDMVKGMLMDVEQSRFETFDDLYLYCYRVAGTVGLMTLPIMGTKLDGPEGVRGATKSAIALGIALQLTNILRDVGEDRLRGRIYLPLEDLRRFNYTEEDLFNCVLDNRYKNLMKFEIARARRYFRQAEKGVALLSEDSQLPVQASLDMYSQILDVLEQNGYDNFNRRAYITKSQKLMTVPLSYMRTRSSKAWQPLLAVAEFLSGAKNKM
uniref:15-cis-phytoene synthase n=1 Tax=Dumontia simplex TaxID=142491 RepID=A0A2D2AGY8_9FLOR|nr:phytoene synthetase [Dumontia simplex]